MGADEYWGRKGADIFVIAKRDVIGGSKGRFHDTVRDFSAADGDIVYLGDVFDQVNAREADKPMVQITCVGGGSMLQIDLHDGNGWQNAVLLKPSPCLALGELVASGNVVY